MMPAVALWLLFGVVCMFGVVFVIQLGLITLHLGDLKMYWRAIVERQERP